MTAPEIEPVIVCAVTGEPKAINAIASRMAEQRKELNMGLLLQLWANACDDLLELFKLSLLRTISLKRRGAYPNKMQRKFFRLWPALWIKRQPTRLGVN